MQSFEKREKRIDLSLNRTLIITQRNHLRLKSLSLTISNLNKNIGKLKNR